MALTKITEKSIKDGEILNADINASAAIAGSKISPNFGSQNIVTTGELQMSGASSHIKLVDSARIDIGTGNDLQIYHNASDGNSYIKESSSGSGCLAIDTDCFRVKNAAHSENLLAADEDGAVQLFYDNSKKFETTSAGVTVTGDITVGTAQILGNGNILLADNDKIKIGTGEDLQIYHNGTSNIIEAVSGDLNIRTNNSENAIVARQNGAAELYYDNDLKFYTTTDGIETDSELHFKAPSSTTGEQVGRIEWWNESDAGVMAKIAVDRTAATAAPTDLVFSTSANIDTTANGGDGDITERMRIDSNGDVIIGTTSWSYKKPLNVQGSSGSILALSNYDTTTYAADTNTSIELRVNTGDTGNQNGSCEIRAFKENGTNGNNARGLSFYTAPNGSSPAEAMRIASDGNALFHTTTNDNTIAGAGGIQLSDDANGSFIRISKKNTYAVPAMEFHNPNGRVGQIIPSGTSTSYSTSGSDRSLKKNFESWSEDVLTLFKNINPQKFNFIQEEDGAEKTKGFIAQEITDSFPEAYIKGFGEDEKYMFNPSGMVVYLMKAIQDLNAKVEALEAA